MLSRSLPSHFGLKTDSNYETNIDDGDKNKN